MKTNNNMTYELCEYDALYCNTPYIITTHVETRGVYWKMTIKCFHCEFHSPKFKVYREIIINKAWSNLGAPNTVLGIGQQDTTFVNYRTRL